MPYDSAGNFTRVHDWTADAAAGIKIESGRMDAEFDNFAAGMNQVLLRSGAIPWEGDLLMGGNRITGLHNGTVESPAIQFLSDTRTGIYLQSLGELGLVSEGVERLRVDDLGIIAVGSVAVHQTDIANAKLALSGNDETSNVIFDVVAASFMQYNIATMQFSYVVNGVTILTIDVNGGAEFRGSVTANAWFITKGGGVAIVTPAGDNRWAVYRGGSETGANAGSDLTFQASDDAGAYLHTPLTLRRSDGASLFGGPIVVNATSYLTDVTANAITGTQLNTKGGVFWQNAGNGVPRWGLMTYLAEDAGNHGSDFLLHRYDNSGAWLGDALTIRRVDGAATFGGGVWANSFSTRSAMEWATPASATRFNVSLNQGEAAGNVGNDLMFYAYANDGAFIGTALQIRRKDLKLLDKDGDILGAARYKPYYLNISTWIPLVAMDWVIVATAGCGFIVLTNLTTQPCPDGWHCKIINHSGAAIVLTNDPGIGQYWMNPANAVLTGNRNLLQLGVAEVIMVDGSWHITGAGIT